MSDHSTHVIPLRREHVDVAELLASSLSALVVQAQERGIEVRISVLDARLPPALLDPDKTAWAVATLVGSALRYVNAATPDSGGGSVLVQVGQDEGRGELWISVHDDGPGIPDDTLATMFRRANRAFHATGLALLLVRDVVSAHGGHLDVQSRVGAEEHGTCVTLRLPFIPPTKASVDEEPTIRVCTSD